MSNEQVWWGQLDNDNKIHALAFTSRVCIKILILLSKRLLYIFY